MTKERTTRRPSWIEVAVRRVGILGARSALMWAISWYFAREDTGPDPTAEEVAEWWRMSARTAYREQANFRRAYPELATPAAIFDSAEARAVLKKMSGGEGITKRSSRKAPSETAILNIGLLPSTL